MNYKNKIVFVSIIIFLSLFYYLHCIFCPYCGFENPDKAKYCMGCGKEILKKVQNDLEKKIQEMREKNVSEETIQMFIESMKKEEIKQTLEIILINEDDKNFQVNLLFDEKEYNSSVLAKDKNIIYLDNMTDGIHTIDVGLLNKSIVVFSDGRKLQISDGVRRKLKFKIEKNGVIKIILVPKKIRGIANDVISKGTYYTTKFETTGINFILPNICEVFNEKINEQWLNYLKRKSDNFRTKNYPNLQLEEKKLNVLFLENYEDDFSINLNDISEVKYKGTGFFGIATHRHMIIKTKNGEVLKFYFMYNSEKVIETVEILNNYLMEYKN